MARTRGAQPTMDQGGELLDKEGKPIPTERSAAIVALAAMAEAAPPPEPAPVVAVPTDYLYRTDKTTWQKNMEAYEALCVLDAIFGGLTITVTPEQWMAFSADVKRHFRRVAVEVSETEPTE